MKRAPLLYDALPDALNLADVFLYRPAEEYGDRPALYCDEQCIRYSELAEQVGRAAALFSRLGLKAGERVLLALPDCPAFASAWLGTLQVGGVAAAIPPDCSADELQFYLDYTEAAFLVTDARLALSLKGLRPRLSHLREALMVGAAPGGPWLGYEEECALQSPSTEVAATRKDSPAAWLFTSGSTGKPKAAVHSQRDFVYSALTYAQAVPRYQKEDVCLSIPKLAFGYALGTQLLFPLFHGSSAVLFRERSAPEKVLELLRRHRPSLLTAVPSALSALLASSRRRSGDFQSLQRCICAGEPLPASLHERWTENTGVEILDGIGSAEMFHIFISNHPGEARPGSLGRPVKGYEAKVCDDEGRPLPAGEVGTLWIKGDSMASEYWRRPDESAHTFQREWCVSADKFRQDEAGLFYFCGRSDDLFKVSGKWLSPLEVESALLSHPAALEAAVVGFKDETGLQKPKAFVVLKSEVPSKTVLADELLHCVRQRLPPFMVPRAIQFLPALPKNERGKVLKSLLKK
jgi:benzoate-CoA ligase family protein